MYKKKKVSQNHDGALVNIWGITWANSYTSVEWEQWETGLIFMAMPFKEYPSPFQVCQLLYTDPCGKFDFETYKPLGFAV